MAAAVLVAKAAMIPSAKAISNKTTGEMIPWTVEIEGVALTTPGSVGVRETGTNEDVVGCSAVSWVALKEAVIV